MIINHHQDLLVMLKTRTEANMREVLQNHISLTLLTFHLQARSKHAAIGHILELTVTKKPQGHQEHPDHPEVQGHQGVPDPHEVRGHHKVQGQHKGQGLMTGQGQKEAIQIIAKARYRISHYVATLGSTHKI